VHRAGSVRAKRRVCSEGRRKSLANLKEDFQVKRSFLMRERGVKQANRGRTRPVHWLKQKSIGHNERLT